MRNTAVTLGNLTLQNPILTASGTCGFGYELAQFFSLNDLGGIAIKGTTLQPRKGNPTPRIAETYCGMLNSVGLQNPGVKAVVHEEIPKLRNFFKGPIIANISGFSLEEYIETAQYFDIHSDAALLEINISCPNVQGGGLAYGVDPSHAAQVCSAVKKVCQKPVYMKLSPNVTDIVSIAKACEDAGADGLTLINTLKGMAIHPSSGKPVLANITGGLSGPAIFPVALAMVYEVYRHVSIPLIGMGGISCADDVICMLSAGASAVQIGAQTLINPSACIDILHNLEEKMLAYGIDDLQEIIGRTHR
ncbi:MAG: dihydroorotate dehydrogenase [Clostridiales bacterium]|nr:dihydroorotate dehydrogenase [Clostridiales bacterium]